MNRSRARSAGVVLVAAMAAVVAPLGVASAAGVGWSQSGGGPGNTAAVTSPGNLSPATVGALTLDYSVPVGDAVTQSPAVVGGVVYAGTFGGRIEALRTSTGSAVWSRALCDGKRPAYNSSEDTSPAVGSGAVFVLGDGGVLTGVKLASPHSVFACVALPGAQNGEGWSPTLTGGVVYADTATQVIAVNAWTGAVLWRHNLPSGFSAASNVVVDGGKAYVAANSGATSVGHVLALRLTDGHVLWSVTRPQFVEMLAAANGRVITGGGAVTAWREAGGAVDWTNPIDGADAVTISGNRVIASGEEATSLQGGLLALDATTGHQLWDVGVGSEEESQPSAGGGVTYLVDLDSSSLVMNRLSDGRRLATVSHPGGYYDGLATPVVVDGHVYLFTQTGSSSNLDRWSSAG